MELENSLEVNSIDTMSTDEIHTLINTLGEQYGIKGKSNKTMEEKRELQRFTEKISKETSKKVRLVGKLLEDESLYVFAIYNQGQIISCEIWDRNPFIADGELFKNNNNGFILGFNETSNEEDYYLLSKAKKLYNDYFYKFPFDDSIVVYSKIFKFNGVSIYTQIFEKTGMYRPVYYDENYEAVDLVTYKEVPNGEKAIGEIEKYIQATKNSKESPDFNLNAKEIKEEENVIEPQTIVYESNSDSTAMFCLDIKEESLPSQQQSEDNSIPQEWTDSNLSPKEIKEEENLVVEPQTIEVEEQFLSPDSLFSGLNYLENPTEDSEQEKILKKEKEISSLIGKPVEAIYHFEAESSDFEDFQNLWLFQIGEDQYEIWDLDDCFEDESLLMDGFVLGFTSMNNNILLIIEAKELLSKYVSEHQFYFCEYSQTRKIRRISVHFQIFLDKKEDKYYIYKYDESYSKILINTEVDIGIASQKIEEYIKEELKLDESLPTIEEKSPASSSSSKIPVTWRILGEKITGSIAGVVFTVENSSLVEKIQEGIERHLGGGSIKSIKVSLAKKLGTTVKGITRFVKKWLGDRLFELPTHDGRKRIFWEGVAALAKA